MTNDFNILTDSDVSTVREENNNTNYYYYLSVCVSLCWPRKCCLTGSCQTVRGVKWSGLLSVCERL